ncbi:Mitotic spindle checkpoint component mad2 [Schizosaccharomyces pombe]|uniref:Mitotic spindle checkpoint component mad2 n=1 Tax=Schizosaccharomyces pombe (strain 972 / ATCC 24843) TaxID=284812 RepID=MAD2_SCHPO|nr:spindle checkpoint protein Mad2 [Schizosaccharomyces pombe]O14417.1 RecName: Full=Mitotic spindle checkpoint component mad2 [Schizosaccharomyces pombe 972h-]AAB68597.1 spindle assembly checkpoint protein Mad2p [Schizosaccharomyces pombe]CAA16846.1 spindle checkpoint protein Mad2 [Schizosaccharomyces pombe]|eukprot:NP_596370.1 spindle checkpoint protein Mad2 [Schizosaccharomyces pombe]
MSSVPIRTNFSLKGSSKLVSEFFEYAVNSILFQRGIYPAEDFKVVRKYGLNMLVSVDEEVKTYIRKIVSQLHKWMFAKKIQKLILVITSKCSGEDLERWQFNVEMVDTADQFQNIGNKEDELRVQKEIQALIRQITATVTFLPQLEEQCTFNVLVYADKDSEVPTDWVDSDPRILRDAEQVQLRSFSTSMHKIDCQVAYRVNP